MAYHGNPTHIQKNKMLTGHVGVGERRTVLVSVVQKALETRRHGRPKLTASPPESNGQMFKLTLHIAQIII